MDGLILFSHGSVLCGAGETLREHAGRLRARGGFAVVEVGFMNYSRPTFAEAAAKCAAAGVSRAIVLPYFLVPGKFVTSDLPKRILEARAEQPGMEFVVAEPVGYHPALADAVLELAAAARTCEDWREDMRRAAAFCEGDPDCPLYDTPRCPLKAKGDWVVGSLGHWEPNHPITQRPNALLVMVHGSPRPEANAPMFRVVEDVRARGVYPIVEVGFLDCNAPDIPTAIDACVAQGAGRVLAVPYFLHTGNHVADDLPTLLEEAQARHPAVEFRLADFLGRSPRLTGILAERAIRVIG
jgi:sirohydrochlorin ferrochelatase